jgi:hypothetical protein
VRGSNFKNQKNGKRGAQIIKIRKKLVRDSDHKKIGEGLKS